MEGVPVESGSRKAGRESSVRKARTCEMAAAEAHAAAHAAEMHSSAVHATPHAAAMHAAPSAAVAAATASERR